MLHWKIGYVICMICMLRYKSIDIYIRFFSLLEPKKALAPRKHSSAFVIICKLVKIYVHIDIFDSWLFDAIITSETCRWVSIQPKWLEQDPIWFLVRVWMKIRALRAGSYMWRYWSWSFSLFLIFVSFKKSFIPILVKARPFHLWKPLPLAHCFFLSPFLLAFFFNLLNISYLGKLVVLS